MTEPHPDCPNAPTRGIGVGGDSSGINSTGDNAVIAQTVYAAPVVTPMEQVDAPTGLGSVPVVPDVFVGREGDLERVEQAMAASAGPVVVTAVHGLGGVGKSTLAARYTATHRGEHTLVWWITADTPSAIETGLARLAVAIQPAIAGLGLEQETEHGLRWLTSHPGWLLILDNLEAPTDASTLLERMSHGRVLITSRRATNWHTGTPLPLDVLDPDDAVDMLTQIIMRTRPSMDCAGAADLCAELGQLPLAIEQAAAYIAQTDIPPDDYQELLRQCPGVMFAETAEGGDAQHTMARIWHVTLDRLADTPVAGQILRILAWYAPKNIPRALLTGIADKPVRAARHRPLERLQHDHHRRRPDQHASPGPGRHPHPRHRRSSPHCRRHHRRDRQGHRRPRRCRHRAGSPGPQVMAGLPGIGTARGSTDHTHCPGP